MQIHKKQKRNTQSADKRIMTPQPVRVSRSANASPMRYQTKQQESGTSVIYMRDTKKFTDMARYIKKLGDERVQCKLEITLESVYLSSQFSDALGPYMIQIVRGPLKSETTAFTFNPNLETQEVELNHTFSRSTTLYKTSDNKLQKKTLLIRLLEKASTPGSTRRVAKVLSEITLDLSQLIGQQNHEQVIQFKSSLAPANCFLKASMSIIEVADEDGVDQSGGLRGYGVSPIRGRPGVVSKEKALIDRLTKELGTLLGEEFGNEHQLEDYINILRDQVEESTDNYKLASIELAEETKKLKEAKLAQAELKQEVDQLHEDLNEEGSRIFDLIQETNQLRDDVQRQKELVAQADKRAGMTEQKLDYAEGVAQQLTRRMTTLTRIQDESESEEFSPERQKNDQTPQSNNEVQTQMKQDTPALAQETPIKEIVSKLETQTDDKAIQVEEEQEIVSKLEMQTEDKAV